MKNILITSIIMFLTIQPNLETKTMTLNLSAIIGFLLGLTYKNK